MDENDCIIKIKIFYNETSIPLTSKNIISFKEIKDESLKILNLPNINENSLKFNLLNKSEIKINSEEDILKYSYLDENDNILIDLNLSITDKNDIIKEEPPELSHKTPIKSEKIENEEIKENKENEENEENEENKENKENININNTNKKVISKRSLEESSKKNNEINNESKEKNEESYIIKLENEIKKIKEEESIKYQKLEEEMNKMKNEIINFYSKIEEIKKNIKSEILKEINEKNENEIKKHVQNIMSELIIKEKNKNQNLNKEKEKDSESLSSNKNINSKENINFKNISVISEKKK